MKHHKGELGICLNPEILRLKVVQKMLREAQPWIKVYGPSDLQEQDWEAFIKWFETAGEFTLWIHGIADDSALGPTLLLTPASVEPRLAITVPWSYVICLVSGSSAKKLGFLGPGDLRKPTRRVPFKATG